MKPKQKDKPKEFFVVDENIPKEFIEDMNNLVKDAKAELLDELIMEFTEARKKTFTFKEVIALINSMRK